jgi:hypothetical protein
VSAPTCTWRTKRELYRKVSLPIYNHADTRIRLDYALSRRVPCVSRGVGPRVSGAYKVSHVLSIAVLTFGFRSARTQRQVDSQDPITKGKSEKGNIIRKLLFLLFCFHKAECERGKAVRATTATRPPHTAFVRARVLGVALTTAQACGWRGATGRASLSASFVMFAQPQREREHRWLRLDGRMVWQSQTS